MLSTVEKGSTDSALNPALEQLTYPTGTDVILAAARAQA